MKKSSRFSIIVIVFIILVSITTMALGECYIAARKWHLAQVEFSIEIIPESDAIVKENALKENYHVDSHNKAFDKNCWVIIPESQDELNLGKITEWAQLDKSTGFRSGDEAIEATLAYADAACRHMPELNGMSPQEALANGAVYYTHIKWDYNASKVATVTDRLQFVGGAKFRVAYLEESEELINEDGDPITITIRTYGLIPGADFTKQGGSKSGGGKKSSGGSTGLITPTPGDDPTPGDEPTPTPPPEPTPPPANTPNPQLPRQDYNEEDFEKKEEKTPNPVLNIPAYSEELFNSNSSSSSSTSTTVTEQNVVTETKTEEKTETKTETKTEEKTETKTEEAEAPSSNDGNPGNPNPELSSQGFDESAFGD